MIEITNLEKTFTVYKNRKGMIKHLFGFAKEDVDYDLVKSLKDVSLSVPEGKVHGIIGMNGAGKSTLLKILTGVLDPSSGEVKIEGRVAALLELGTGFHPELTGRENIELNATIMGFSKEEIQAKMEEILAFSELEKFFDRPIKIYSSGMYVRLAFSFAVFIDPDVLIIDEALSVGDVYFQQKCLKKIIEFKKKGVTILFVSHDLGSVKMLCDEVSLLHKGTLVYTGEASKAMDLYNAILAEQKNDAYLEQKVAEVDSIEVGDSYESGTKEIEISKIEILGADNKQATAIVSGTNASFLVYGKVNSESLAKPTCGILIRDRMGYDVFGINSCQFEKAPEDVKSGDNVLYRFDVKLNLGPGDYTLSVALHSDKSHVNDNYHWIDRAEILQVLPSSDIDFIGVARVDTTCSVRVN